MPYPILAILATTAIQAALQYFGRPKEDAYRLSPEEQAKLISLHSQMINRAAEGTASNAGQAAAGRASAAGLGGGAFVSSVNEAEAPIYAQAAQANAEFAGQLAGQDAMGRAQYKQDWAQYNRDILGGIGNNVIGGTAAYFAANAQDKALDKMIGAFGQQGGNGVGGMRTISLLNQQQNPNASFGNAPYGMRPSSFGLKQPSTMNQDQLPYWQRESWRRPRLGNNPWRS